MSIPLTYTEAIGSPEAQEWRIAMDDQLSKLRDRDTYDEIAVNKESKQRVLPAKWVFDIKKDTDNIITAYRARLVVCGNRQRPGYDFDESYSPVACPQAVKLFNCAVARKKLKVRQFDIITAYLNAEIDNRRILMKMPPGYTKTGVAWVLKRALYGLRQAGCLWHQTFKDCLMKLGWKPFPTDPCVFSRNDCFIIIYVDDAQVASESDTLNDTIVSEIARSFNLKDSRRTGEVSGMYTGSNA